MTRGRTGSWFCGSKALFLVNAYAPTCQTSVDEREEFFAQLGQVVNKWAQSGKVVLVGDLNAHLGNQSDMVGPYNDPSTNANAPLLMRVLKNNKLVALNGWNKTDEPEFTWSNCQGSKAVIDFVCVPAEFKDQTRFKVLELTMGSDHHVLEADLTGMTMEWAPPTAPGKRVKKANFHLLIRGDQEAIEGYQEACDEKFKEWKAQLETTKWFIKNDLANTQSRFDVLQQRIVDNLHDAVNERVPQTEVTVGGQRQVQAFLPLA